MKLVKQVMKSFMVRLAINILSLLLILIFGCENENSVIEENIFIREKLQKLIIEADNKDGFVDLSQLITNGFDTVYIFKPYTPLESIENYTNLNLRQLKWFDTKIESESRNAVVDENQ